MNPHIEIFKDPSLHQENINHARFSSTHTKIGMIQRRLAWPLFKDDTQIREAFHIFGLRSLKLFQKLEENGDLYLPV